MAKPFKLYTVLATVKSRSDVSVNYEIRTSHQDGVMYCTCRGWQMRKTCRHLDAYKNAPTNRVMDHVHRSTIAATVSPLTLKLVTELRRIGIIITTSQGSQVIDRLGLTESTPELNVPTLPAGATRIIYLP